MKKSYLWLEFAALFIGTPLLISVIAIRWLMIVILWSATAFIFCWLRRRPDFKHGAEWHGSAARRPPRNIILLFIVAAIVLTIATYYLQPDLFLSLPRERPKLWLTIMVVYPVLSVWPQELIYRSWLYHRYQPLWQTPRGYMVMSALAFGFMHVIFQNWIAVILSTAGGAVFAMTYLRQRSLALCCLEHALYGCLIFTIGLGRYFFSGVHFH